MLENKVIEPQDLPGYVHTEHGYFAEHLGTGKVWPVKERGLRVEVWRDGERQFQFTSPTARIEILTGTKGGLNHHLIIQENQVASGCKGLSESDKGWCGWLVNPIAKRLARLYLKLEALWKKPIS